MINPTNITKYSIFTRSTSRPIALRLRVPFHPFSFPNSWDLSVQLKAANHFYAPFDANLYLFQSPSSR
jgi:hypothetical protein